MNYVYDDNVLYFFKKDSSDPNNIKYIAVDWYGRIIDKKWKENRKNHNRRVCYEFARFYAKAINEMLIGNDNCEAFMLGDKENLHYVVGLTGNEYSIILDPDDFNNIKGSKNKILYFLLWIPGIIKSTIFTNKKY